MSKVTQIGRILSGAALAAALFFMPSASSAITCPPGTATEVTQAANYAELVKDFAQATSILKFFETTYKTITTALENSQVGTIAATFTSAKLSMEGMARIQDVKNSVQWGIANAQAQAQAAAQTRPSAGALQQIGTGLRRTYMAGLVGQAIIGQLLSGEVADMGNTSPSTTKGTFAQSVKAYEYEQSLYAQCDELDTTTCNQGILPNGDVRPLIIFGYSTIFPNPAQQAKGISSENLEQAAIDYCKNLISPLAENPLQGDLLRSPRGISAEMERKAGDSRLSLAQYACHEMIGERTPGSTTLPNGMGNATVSGAADTMAWGVATLKLIGYTPAMIPPVLSEHELMKILYNDQFATPAWDMLVNIDNETNQTKILAALTSLRLQMQWRNHHQIEEIMMMQAAENAAKIEDTRLNYSIDKAQ